MIVTKEVAIDTTDEISSEYIELHLKKMGFNVLRWAIVDIKDGKYILNLAVLEN